MIKIIVSRHNLGELLYTKLNINNLSDKKMQKERERKGKERKEGGGKEGNC
jgi:hypothetical protein